MTKEIIKIFEDNSNWDNLVSSSNDGTIFHKLEYLDCIKGINIKILKISYKDSIRAGCVLVDNSTDEKKFDSDDQVIYSGLIFFPLKGLRKAKFLSDSHIITREVCSYLERNFKSIRFNLSPTINDIRPFQWHNFGNDGRKYKIGIRYTSKLKLDNSLITKENGENLFNNLEPIRRYSIRQAIKQQFKCEFCTNIDKSIKDYYEMMETYSENKSILRNKCYEIRDTLIELRNKNILKSCTVFNKRNKPSYTVFYICDEKRAYYLYGMKNKNTGQYEGTYANWSMWESLYSNHNVKEIDLEGVNSPNRGWFKLSFGGSLETYYSIKLDEPNL